MSLAQTQDVREVLAGYADRGVFRGVNDAALAGETAEFKFTWFGIRPMRCLLAPPSITLRDFLHAMPTRSDMHRDIKAFVAAFNEPGLLEHRGLDSNRASVKTANRNQRVSLSVTSLDGDYAYATRKLIFVAHETWQHIHCNWVHYAWDECGASME
ncbi:hypothetical protein [Methylobacterium brachythecii]|uniref:Uncharacterized protein n=1 Tax=Methylobacterium brachythecii TaxID=1176177 RepID=A0A7W6AET8_9HYPH|nr:hypothetical protein [Methylobacterium brachythecii]MBB3901393.1 hypothetical protein [Methylobacterium brachythecii]GLS42968.1 hypothetical protein GCM10007884_09530 [Methylobacterium brachythecii]